MKDIMEGNMKSIEIKEVKNGFIVYELNPFEDENKQFVFESFWSMSIWMQDYFRSGENGN